MAARTDPLEELHLDDGGAASSSQKSTLPPAASASRPEDPKNAAAWRRPAATSTSGSVARGPLSRSTRASRRRPLPGAPKMSTGTSSGANNAT